MFGKKINTNEFVKLVNSFEHDFITKLHTMVNMKYVTNKAKIIFVYPNYPTGTFSVCVCRTSSNPLQMFTCTVLVIYATCIVLIKTGSILNSTFNNKINRFRFILNILFEFEILIPCVIMCTQKRIKKVFFLP